MVITLDESGEQEPPHNQQLPVRAGKVSTQKEGAAKIVIEDIVESSTSGMWRLRCYFSHL